MKMAAVILAAGQSSRLGQSKPLLKLKDEYVLLKLYQNLEPKVKNINVITGFDHKKIKKQFPEINLVFNENWHLGMGSSIIKSVLTLKKGCTHLLICVCDQLLIQPDHYEKLISTSKLNPNKIITSFYQETHGVPCVFPKEYFSKILKLKDTSNGAKSIITENLINVIGVDCPSAQFDLDSKKDLELIENLIINNKLNNN